MPVFGKASKTKLATCDQRLQLICNDAIEIFDFTIVEGHRNKADQDRAFAQGKSKLKWPKGKHNTLPSMAVDIAPVYYENGIMKIDWSDTIAFGRLMGVVQACAYKRGIKVRFGLDWDADQLSVNRDPTESFLDAPHVELVEP